MRSTLSAAALLVLALAAAPPPAEGCVGRKLVLGALSGERDAMISRVLSILVHERTGTTVELRFFTDGGELSSAVAGGKVDLFVGYSAADSLAAVRKRDDEERNLVWGKPLGCEGRGSPGTSPGLAVPVVRKDTLKKFPALPRLLEKVGSRTPLDDAALDALVEKGGGGREEKAARDWLREVRLI